MAVPVLAGSKRGKKLLPSSLLNQMIVARVAGQVLMLAQTLIQTGKHT